MAGSANQKKKQEEADKLKAEMTASGKIKVGHKIYCDGTTSQRFWTYDNTFIDHFCIDCNQEFRISTAKDAHVIGKHSQSIVCVACKQVVPKKGPHVNTVPSGFGYNSAGDGASTSTSAAGASGSRQEED